MTDYGHELRFGTNLAPAAGDLHRVLELASLTEVAGLDLVTVQDHPYQARFLDAWTLLTAVAARTSSVTVAPNVANLPLRPPVVLARAAASLDLISGGRVELGLGAGAFWDAIVANGGRRLSPKESVDALAEAIEVIRAVWSSAGPVKHDGEHYRVVGAHAGPVPTHPIGIWLGAYKPRMLRLTGAAADGWLPSWPYAGPEQLPAMNAVIDQAAYDAGRAPEDVRRLYNVNAAAGGGPGLVGSYADWAEQLTELTLDAGISSFVLGTDDPAVIRAYGQEVAPAVRELVEAERSGVSRRAPAREQVEVQPGAGQHLVDVHDMLRAELAQVRDLVEQVSRGAVDVGRARSLVNLMTMRQNNWTLGAYCESYCRIVTTHHTLEDRSVFPHLRRAEPDLAPVLDRLEAEHHVVADVLDQLDRALVALVSDPAALPGLRTAVDLLADTLLDHLAYEESQLIEPLNRNGFY